MKSPYWRVNYPPVVCIRAGLVSFVPNLYLLVMVQSRYPPNIRGALLAALRNLRVSDAPHAGVIVGRDWCCSSGVLRRLFLSSESAECTSRSQSGAAEAVQMCKLRVAFLKNGGALLLCASSGGEVGRGC